MKSVFNLEAMATGIAKAVLTHGPKIILILILSWVAMRAVRLATRQVQKTISWDDDSIKREAKGKRAKTLIGTINSSLKIIIFIFTGTMLLQELGVSIGPILAGIGFAGLAFGFGAQSLVKDIVTGFFLLIENQFSVGDVVKINGISGMVEAISLRVTTLRDMNGAVHYIPNGLITTVSNMTKGWSRALLDVSVGFNENVDRVMNIIRDACGDIKGDESIAPLLIGDFELLGVENLSDTSATIRVMAKTKPLKQWEVMREMRRRIKNRFDEAGIGRK